MGSSMARGQTLKDESILNRSARPRNLISMPKKSACSFGTVTFVPDLENRGRTILRSSHLFSKLVPKSEGDF